MNTKSDASNDELIDYVVVGGGISGLYCCYHLKKNFPGKTIHLYEASDRLGGRIQTWRINPQDFDGLRPKPGAPPQINDLRDPIVRLIKENDRRKRKEENLRLKDDLRLEDDLRSQGKADSTHLPEILIAEFGPMRIEPDHQPYLKRLLDDIGIKKHSGRPDDPEKWSDLVPFPAYQSEPPAPSRVSR